MVGQTKALTAVADLRAALGCWPERASACERLLRTSKSGVLSASIDGNIPGSALSSRTWARQQVVLPQCQHRCPRLQGIMAERPQRTGVTASRPGQAHRASCQEMRFRKRRAGVQGQWRQVPPGPQAPSTGGQAQLLRHTHETAQLPAWQQQPPEAAGRDVARLQPLLD